MESRGEQSAEPPKEVELEAEQSVLHKIAPIKPANHLSVISHKRISKYTNFILWEQPSWEPDSVFLLSEDGSHQKSYSCKQAGDPRCHPLLPVNHLRTQCAPEPLLSRVKRAGEDIMVSPAHL